MIDNSSRVYTIKEVSEITGVPIYKIRQWEKKVGKLKPRRHPKNNWRYYTEREIEIIKNINYLITKRKIKLAGVDDELTKIEFFGADDLQTRDDIKVLLKKIKLELLEMKNLLQYALNTK
ncbi:MAG: MerR family transcriptional regulator [candidate division WOR-3 bacterium]